MQKIHLRASCIIYIQTHTSSFSICLSQSLSTAGSATAAAVVALLLLLLSVAAAAVLPATVSVLLAAAAVVAAASAVVGVGGCGSVAACSRTCTTYHASNIITQSAHAASMPLHYAERVLHTSTKRTRRNMHTYINTMYSKVYNSVTAVSACMRGT
jgi:hypothetical protein